MQSLLARNRFFVAFLMQSFLARNHFFNARNHFFFVDGLLALKIFDFATRCTGLSFCF